MALFGHYGDLIGKDSVFWRSQLEVFTSRSCLVRAFSQEALAAQARISPELAASRLGHKDAGHVLVTVDAETRRENLRAKLQAIAAEGGSMRASPRG